MWNDDVHMINVLVSDSYASLKLGGYNLLETRNRQIVRRLNPCPKAYKKSVVWTLAVNFHFIY